MGFFQKIGNAFARFMYGRNGGDHLGLFMIWVAVTLDIINMFIKNQVVYGAISIVSAVLVLLALLRMFSKNLYKRRAENAKFLDKVWWPLKRRLSNAKQQAADKEHKYFSCPNCRTVCRVPRGKGKIVITCPKCSTRIQGKS